MKAKYHDEQNTNILNTGSVLLMFHFASVWPGNIEMTQVKFKNTYKEGHSFEHVHAESTVCSLNVRQTPKETRKQQQEDLGCVSFLHVGTRVAGRSSGQHGGQ